MLKSPNKLLKKNAFALMEVLVAIALLSVAIISIATLTFSMLRANAGNKNQLIALELSREGIEMVRTIRDTNWNNYDYWLENLCEPTLTTTCDFTVDFDKSLEYPFVLNQGDTSSLFKRQIVITALEVNCVDSVCVDESLDPNQVVRIGVQSKVNWLEKGEAKEVALETELSDWNVLK